MAGDRGQAARHWLAGHDPGWLNVKRAVRAAVVIPVVFALTLYPFDNPQTPLFGVFGSFALLLLVDFTGSPRARLRAYLTLFLVGVAFISVGTLSSTHPVVAPLTMAVVGFGVLFAGVAAPRVAQAATAALLVYVLPVAVPAPASAVGDRLVGFLVAGAFSITACMVVWPPPWRESLRIRLASAARAVARLVGAHTEQRRDSTAWQAAMDELDALRLQFESSPYPPTGAGPGDAALARLVGHMEWVGHNATVTPTEAAASFGLPDVDAIHRDVAATLQAIAAVVSDDQGRPPAGRRSIGELQTQAAALERSLHWSASSSVARVIDHDVAQPPQADDPGSRLLALVDPSFRARALAVATSSAAAAALSTAPANRGDHHGRADLGRVARTLAGHVGTGSAWFRNSVRGAAALAFGVGLVELTAVGHGFWVILGTLSVLRSNALGTGASALRAVGGTVVGFIIGSAILLGPGREHAVLWALLPLAVFVAGTAPSMISFTAGQAAFTVVVLIIFNLISPAGWSVGLVRIEDVVLGCAVSVVVGLLFWPRGATAQLGRALARAYATASAYLSVAVGKLVAVDVDIDVQHERARADLAYSRLDDAFRQFVGERGAKVLPVRTVTDLFTGAVRMRMAARSLETMPPITSPPGERDLPPVTQAGHRLQEAFEHLRHWFALEGGTMAGRVAPVEPPHHGGELHRDILRAFRAAQAGRRTDQVRSTLRMLWADELLEEMGAVERELAAHARDFGGDRLGRWI